MHPRVADTGPTTQTGAVRVLPQGQEDDSASTTGSTEHGRGHTGWHSGKLHTQAQGSCVPGGGGLWHGASPTGWLHRNSPPLNGGIHHV